MSFFGDFADVALLFAAVSLLEPDGFCHSTGLLRYIGHGGSVNCHMKI